MPFWRSYAHLVWATHDRQPFLQPQIEEALYAYILKKAGELDTYIHAINGWLDHTHIVASIPPKHSVKWVVQGLKGAGSHYVNFSLRPPQFHFGWQRGYGYLTMGESQCERAIAYVRNQKAHHEQQTVNAWLERYAEEDEGPPMPELMKPFMPGRTLREEAIHYQVNTEFPF